MLGGGQVLRLEEAENLSNARDRVSAYASWQGEAKSWASQSRDSNRPLSSCTTATVWLYLDNERRDILTEAMRTVWEV
jgi:hypothetical protein